MKYNKIAVLGHSFVSHLESKNFKKCYFETSIRLDLGLKHTEALYFGAPGLTTAGVQMIMCEGGGGELCVYVCVTMYVCVGYWCVCVFVIHKHYFKIL